MNLFYKLIRFYSHTSNNVRVRFAPSPTGLLHLGGLRTALYNYLFARATDGKFILRIENTDQTRIVPGAVEKLIFDLNWSGIISDEGPETEGLFGPYIQSERIDLYKETVRKLLKSETAYCCFCTDSRLNILRKDSLKSGQVPRYDNKCRNLSLNEVEEKINSGQTYCIRFKLSYSEQFEDLVYGPVKYNVEDVEGDPVILKSDGYPTYHLASVVDDHLMEISHVIRGVEWLQSTNKHIMIYRALGYKLPIFCHLPLLMNSDGTKLSKRQGDITVESFRNGGVEPRALINFIVTSGGGFKHNNYVRSHSIDELSKMFDLNLVNTNSCKLSIDRLKEFNRIELSRKLNNNVETKMLVKDVQHLITNTFIDKDCDNLELNENYIKMILNWSMTRIYFLKDLVSKDLRFIWIKPDKLDIRDCNPDLLIKLIKLFKNFQEDTNINEELKEFSKNENVPFKEVTSTLRKSLSGLEKGPPIAEIVKILGQKNTVDRLDRAVKIIADKKLSQEDILSKSN